MPGPGAYNIQSGFQKFRNSINGTSKMSSALKASTVLHGSKSDSRSLLIDNGIPGPGAYLKIEEMIYKNEKGTRFGSGVRQELTSRDVSANPGPA